MNSQQFLSARKDRTLAVLEGFHPLKHALRFEAEIVDAITPDKQELIQLSKRLAPDVLAVLEEKTREVGAEEFDSSSSIQITSGVLAVAKRRNYEESIIQTTNKTVVWLDEPKNHENVGAVIRLAAGIGAGAVVVTGDLDIWNPGVLRGSAGLHYSLPVVKTDKLPAEFNKAVYAFDENGENFEAMNLRERSILVFGGERSGLSERIKSDADVVVGIPMEEGVSSLNLATSVAVGLYGVMSKL